MSITRFQPIGFGGTKFGNFDAGRPDLGIVLTRFGAWGFGVQTAGNFDRSSRPGGWSTGYLSIGFGGTPEGDFSGKVAGGRPGGWSTQWSVYGYGGLERLFTAKAEGGGRTIGTVTRWGPYGYTTQAYPPFTPKQAAIYNALFNITVDWLSPAVGQIAVKDGFNATLSATLADATGAFTGTLGALTFNAQLTGTLADATGQFTGTFKPTVNAVLNATLADAVGSFAGSQGLLTNRAVLNAQLEDATGAFSATFISLSNAAFIGATLEDATAKFYAHVKKPEDDQGEDEDRRRRIASPSTLVDSTGRFTEQGLDWINRITRAANAVTESGPTSARPTTDLWVGRPYFDTTLGKALTLKSVGPPVVWQDSFLNEV